MSLKVADRVEPFLKKLICLWDDIGISEEQQCTRHDTVLLHISNLLEEMILEEESLQKNLKESTEKYSTKLLNLCKEMDLPNFETPKSDSLVVLEKELRSRYEVLKREKHELLSEFNKLTDEDRQLCKRMNISPLKVMVDTIPKRDQLVNLKAHVDERKQELVKRQQNYDVVKEKIVGLIEALNQVPETKFERDVIHEPADSFILSAENMISLKEFCDCLELQLEVNRKIVASLLSRLKLLFAELGIGEIEQTTFFKEHSGFSSKSICGLQEEVKRLESLKEQKASEIVKDAQKQLKILWDLCFYSQEQRDSYQHLCQCDHNLVNVEAIQKEIEKAQSYYDKHKIILDRINRYQETFKEYIQTERKAVNPDRLYTGSSNFLLEEKARSRLVKEIAESEQDALSAVEVWEKQTGCLFLVNGSRFKDHVKNQWQEFKAEMAEEQIRRLKAKVAQSEAITPGKNKSPAKRLLTGVTPNKVASKLMKFEIKGTQSAPHSRGFSNSPRQRGFDFNGGFFVARDPKPVSLIKHFPEKHSSPLLASKKINHGCLFASIPKLPSSADIQVNGGKNKLSPLNGVRITAAKRKLWAEDKSSKPSVKCSSENVNPLLFGSTAVTSGIQPLPESDLKLNVCESAPSKPSYQDFMDGLSDSGKTNFCSSIISPK